MAPVDLTYSVTDNGKKKEPLKTSGSCHGNPSYASSLSVVCMGNGEEKQSTLHVGFRLPSLLLWLNA